MRKEKSVKKRKIEIILSLLFLLLLGMITIKANQLYLNPEKAFRDAASLEGLDHTGEIFLIQEKDDGQRIYMISELNYQLEGSFVALIDMGGRRINEFF